MENLKHKGYIGSIDYSEEDNCLFGKVIGLNKVMITYEGNTIQELKDDFIAGVNQYIESCITDGVEPQKSFTGAFNVRVPSDIHAKAVLKAKESGLTLNAFVKTAIEEKLNIKRIMIEKAS